MGYAKIIGGMDGMTDTLLLKENDIAMVFLLGIKKLFLWKRIQVQEDGETGNTPNVRVLVVPERSQNQSIVTTQSHHRD